MALQYLNTRRLCIAVVLTFALFKAALADDDLHSNTMRMRRPVKRSIAKIVYAADNEGKLFVNGKEVSEVKDWNEVKRKDVLVGRGDTISIKATDQGVWYGVIADIYYEGRHYGTGHRGWKAVKEFNLKGRSNKDAWMLSQYNTCRWPKAVEREESDVVAGMAADFPYDENNAKYVWAKNAEAGDSIFLRFKIGGENCASRRSRRRRQRIGRRTQKRVDAAKKKIEEAKKKAQKALEKLQKAKKKVERAKRKIKHATGKAKHSTNTKNQRQPNKQSAEQNENKEEDKTGNLYCPCKEAVGPIGKCWEMLPGEGTHCKERDCITRFECVSSDEADVSNVCIRRYATEKVVMDDELGNGHCKTVLIPASRFYVPYSVPER